MTIMFRCIQCENEYPLTAKKCPGCGLLVPAKNRKYKVTVRHERRKRSKVVDNLSLAREIETQLKHDIARGTFHLHTRKQAPTLDQFWEKEYLPWIKSRKKSWETDNRYFRKNISPALGKKPLDKISQLDIERLLSNMRKNGWQKEKQGKEALRGTNDKTPTGIVKPYF